MREMAQTAPRLLAALLLLLSGCLDALQTRHFACGPGCPPGFSCVEGLCYTSDDLSPDAGSGDRSALDGCRVVSASLVIHFNQSSTDTLGLHQVLQPWDRSASWSSAQPGIAWSSAGCDAPSSCRVDPPFRTTTPSTGNNTISFPSGL